MKKPLFGHYQYLMRFTILPLASACAVSCSNLSDSVIQTISVDHSDSQYITHTPGDSKNPITPEQISASISVFSNTVFPIVRQHCGSCHGTIQEPKFAVADPSSAHGAFITWQLVNANSVPDSKIVKKLVNNHNGFSSVLGPLEPQIIAWVNGVSPFPGSSTPNPNPGHGGGGGSTPGDGGGSGSGTPPVVTQPVLKFQPTSLLSAAIKSKYLIHGGGLTTAEETQVKNNENASEAAKKNLLSSFVNNWIETPEASLKIQKFLSVNLQQDGDRLYSGRREYWPILGTISDHSAKSCAKMVGNLREMFVRTTMNIIETEQPFNQIANTRKWMVTTALLVQLAFMDNDRSGLANGATRGFTQFSLITKDICDPLLLTDEDYQDWRPVTFTTAPNNVNPRPYTDVNGWRATTANATVALAVPRVGFFMTPMFLRKWITNNDNQFRVTTNQALIGALNQTFSLDDITEALRPLGANDSMHANPGTACFACHKLMDPMREVFRFNLNALDYRFHPRTPASTDRPQFAFKGVRRAIDTIEDFADTLSTHPEFASGWTQKICQYMNSQDCDTTDPEFKALVTRFKNSGMNFKTVFKEMAVSPIITGFRKTQTHDKFSFYVSISRKNHICHAINVRTRAFQAADGITPEDLDGGLEVCDGEKARYRAYGNTTPRIVISQMSAAIPNDSLNRGSTILTQSLNNSPFYIQATEKLCWYASFHVLGMGTRTSVRGTTSDAMALQSLDNFVIHFMGMGSQHPRRSTVRTALQNVYNTSLSLQATSIPNLTDRRSAALQDAFTFGCSLPDFVGLGL